MFNKGKLFYLKIEPSDKDCQKCARAKHGNECIGEFVKYTWRYSKKNKNLGAQEVCIRKSIKGFELRRN